MSKPAAPAPRSIYDSAIEGLFVRALGPKLAPSAKARLKAAGLDLGTKLKPTYTLEQFREFAEIARQEVFPNLPKAEAHRRMGDLMISGYGATLFGRTVLSMLKLMGVERSLRRLDANLRGVNNFTETKITHLGPGEAEYFINVLSISPDFTMGLIRAGLNASGGEVIEVRPIEGRGDGHHFFMKWSERKKN